eukprot:gene25538-30042_t
MSKTGKVKRWESEKGFGFIIRSADTMVDLMNLCT